MFDVIVFGFMAAAVLTVVVLGRRAVREAREQ